MSDLPGKQIQKKRTTVREKRVAIPDDEQRKLWVRSGGRCAFCNTYLLEDEWFSYELWEGEMAHIVGATNNARSPRGKHPSSLPDRNNADNLVLVCKNHHAVIDSEKQRSLFSVERLQKQKKKHEERIYHLTGLAENRETAVVRVLGDIRGATVEVSREHAAQTVFQSADRYASFPFSNDRQSIEIDLSNLGDPEHLGDAYWKAGQKIIDKGVSRIREGVNEGEVRHLSLFALTRIPLLIYFGFHLDDKIPTDFYQKQRGGDESWGWFDDKSLVEFEFEKIRTGSQSDQVALILSVSGSIPLCDLPAEIEGDTTVFEIRPTDATPSRDVLRNRASLDAFSRCYHGFLSELEVKHKLVKTLHLFPSLPVSAAISCGRGIMRDVQPALRIYERIGNAFSYALTVNQP